MAGTFDIRRSDELSENKGNEMKWQVRSLNLLQAQKQVTYSNKCVKKNKQKEVVNLYIFLISKHIF